MPGLAFYLFGSPRLECNGKPVVVDTRKAIALLAYLALEPGSHGRDSLAALFWPDFDQIHGRAALRRTLSSLKHALGEAVLEVGRDDIRMEPGTDLWVDVREFQKRLSECALHGHPKKSICPRCMEPLTAAAALYRGDFMLGFSLRDSLGFDDWQFFQGENLRREAGNVLERLTAAHTDLGEWDQAIEYARRWLKQDPLQETAHRELMQLYSWKGERNAALRQYQECAHTLETELGVEPLEETTQLYLAIKENRLVAPTQTSLPYRLSTPIQPPGAAKLGLEIPEQIPLVGRIDEWQILLQAYDSLGRDGYFLALEGEAGIGKSRLAEEFLAAVRSRGGITLVGRCYEGEANLAYGPFIECLRSGIDEYGLPRLRETVGDQVLNEALRLLPELVGGQPGVPASSGDGEGNQQRLFDAVQRVLVKVCDGGRPGVIFLDDFHWADSASLDLLNYLARRLSGHTLLLLVAWRDDLVGDEHRLRRLLAELERRGRAAAVRLARLKAQDVADLMASTVATENISVQEIGQRLYAETEGLPFFVVEYIAVIKTIRDSHQAWQIPSGVRELLRSRLRAVSEAGRQLLQTAAVAGRTVDFDILKAAGGRSEEETLVALEELLAHKLLVDASGSNPLESLVYDFSHEKLRAFVYEETSLPRRRLLHRRVAEAIFLRARERKEIGALAGQIAQHYRLAGQDSDAARFFQSAGDYERSLYAHKEAINHFRSALELGAPDRAELYEAIGDLQVLGGEYSASLKSFEESAALYRDSLIDQGRLAHKMGEVYARRGDQERAEALFETARSAYETGERTGDLAHLYVDWSRLAYQIDQLDLAHRLADQALNIGLLEGDQRIQAQANNLLGVLARRKGESDQAKKYVKSSLALAEALNDLPAQVAALNNLALICGQVGDLKQAITLAEMALRLCTRSGDRHREAAIHNNLADLHHWAGQADSAMAHLKSAVAIFSEIGGETGADVAGIWKLTDW
jgi:predicted ATPase/DNA-binding SARP family transcriptional activator